MLNGTSAAGTVNLLGGTLALGADERLADSTTPTLGSGAMLDLGAHLEIIDSFTLAGGTLAGSDGTLFAFTSTQNGGTVNADLVAFTLTRASGTTQLNGNRLAATLTVSGGTLLLNGMSAGRAPSICWMAPWRWVPTSGWPTRPHSRWAAVRRWTSACTTRPSTASRSTAARSSVRAR